MRHLVILACPMLAAAQINVRAERIAGLLPSEWDPAAVISPVALAFERNGNLLIADRLNNRIWRMRPDGALATVIRGADYGLSTFIVSMAVDSKGNVYLSDAGSSAPAPLVRIGADGRFSVIDGVKRYPPPGIAVDASDTLYLAEPASSIVWRRLPNGTLQKVAGTGRLGIEGEGGPALAASLLVPQRLAFDARGNLLIADGQRLLRVNADGTLVRLTTAGMETGGGTVAGAPDGSVYIGGYASVFRWDPRGAVTIVAGTSDVGFSDGCASSGGRRMARAASVSPRDLAVDAAGRVYVADASQRLRRIELNGEIRTVAGSGLRPQAPGVLYFPGALAVDDAGNIYVAEPSANRVRQVTPSGELRTIAGIDAPPPGEDPACYPAARDILSIPRAIAVDAKGNLYITETWKQRIQRRSPDGSVTLIPTAGLVTGIASDPHGDIFAGDSSSGLVRIGSDGRTQLIDRLFVAGGLAFGPDGRIFANTYPSGLLVGRPAGQFLPLGVMSDVPEAIAVDAFGSVYIAGRAGALTRVTSGCNRARLAGPWDKANGVATDRRGNVYVSDSHAMWRFPAIPPTGAEASSPLVDNAGIRNAASNQAINPNPFSPNSGLINDAIAPGEILRIRGGCMGPLEPVAGRLVDGRLTTELAGTRVVIDGVAAPLFRAQSAEILAVVPRGVAGKTGAPLTVEYNGGSVAERLRVAAAVPGVFLSQDSRAAALNQDSTLNTPANPAALGSVVSLFLTGTGLTEPPLEDGALPTEPFPRLRWPVAVRISDTPAEVLYAGAAPALVGVAQVNIRIPPVAASLAARVSVSVSSIALRQYVTLAVGPARTEAGRSQ